MTDELKNSKLSANRRNEFTRDICSSMRVYTMNPTRAEREHVAIMIIQRYPSLADSLGTGIVSVKIFTFSSLLTFLYPLYHLKLLSTLILITSS